MTINELRKQFPDEETCRLFFESVMWPSGRVCPHCGSSQSWKVRSESVRDGLYLCGGCRLQFTVTTKTPLHSTKLPLWKWLLAMYLLTSSSKGISSVVTRWYYSEDGLESRSRNPGTDDLRIY